jgi:hypothetical protein
MRNVLEKSCIENQNIQFMFNNLFPIMSKNMSETIGPQITSQYGAYALHAGFATLNLRMRMHKPTRAGTHMQASTYCSFTATLIRERASILRCLSCLLSRGRSTATAQEN